jgi:hypothetical protein
MKSSEQENFITRELLIAQAAAQREGAVAWISNCRHRCAIAARTVMLAKLAVSPVLLALLLPRTGSRRSGSRKLAWILTLLYHAGRGLLKQRFSSKI